jgi:ABC-type multidrug transport system ATPase subunit
VWELISASKAGRCLVLTTHSMEEAEVLGDRIAILAAGGCPPGRVVGGWGRDEG